MENDATNPPRLGWSDFARRRYVQGAGHTWYEGTPDELLALVREHWSARRPGRGRTGLDEVVVVDVPPAGFHGSTVRVEEGTRLTARLTRRGPEEEPYVEVRGDGPREEVRHAGVVLYSAAVLEANGGTRSGDHDWEVVALLAAPVPDEPMDPLTMARNMLAKPGGTPCDYTAEEFAAAVWYWARRVKAED